MKKVLMALTLIAQLSFSQSLFSDTAQKPVDLDSYIDNLILPVAVYNNLPRRDLIKKCIEPLQKGDLEKAERSARSGQCFPYYYIAKEYHKVALKREEMYVYYIYLRPITPSYYAVPLYSMFYELLIRARASEKLGDTSTASMGYALLLASSRYGRYYFMSHNFVPPNIKETLIPSAIPYNLWEDWLERKVKELGGERYYKRYLRRFHMDYYLVLSTKREERFIYSEVFSSMQGDIESGLDAIFDRLLALEREVLQ